MTDEIQCLYADYWLCPACARLHRGFLGNSDNAVAASELGQEHDSVYPPVVPSPFLTG
jgi:hypothetical protein